MASAPHPSSGIMQCLRAATASQHAALDDILDLTRSDFELSDYILFLRQFYRVCAAWEPRADAVLGDRMPALLADRRKVGLLVSDLRHLQAALPAPLPPESMEPFDSPASVLGGMYVLEGSTLGGQLLYRHFHGRFGVTQEAGGAWFYGYGSRTGSMWKEFGLALDSFASNDNVADEMIAGAVRMFELVREQLCAR